MSRGYTPHAFRRNFQNVEKVRVRRARGTRNRVNAETLGVHIKYDDDDDYYYYYYY